MTAIALPGLPKSQGKLIRPQCCATCKWSETEGPGSPNLFCHKNPPAVSILPTSKGPMPFTAFPIVQPEHWCGAHAPKLNGDAANE